MGVRGIKGLEAIQRTLEVESPIINVHMAVFCLKLGKRVQVRTCGYAELNLLRYILVYSCFFYVDLPILPPTTDTTPTSSSITGSTSRAI